MRDLDRKYIIEAQGIVGEIRAGSGRYAFRLTFEQAVRAVAAFLKAAEKVKET